MIHCLQLWIIYASTEAVPFTISQPDSHAVKKFIKQLCDQHLLNNIHSAATELSYWRLLAWTASKDTVTASVITLNANATIISHLHLTLTLNQ